MIRWCDTAFNWDDPAAPGPWRQEECDRFNATVPVLFERLRHELGAGFDLVCEQEPLREDPDLDEYLRDPRGFRRR